MVDIITDKDINDELMNIWESGGGEIKDVGFNRLRGFYGVMPGSCTDWTGFSVSGKTELLYEVLINMTEFYGWKHLLWMPDAGSEAQIVQDLIEKSSKKTFKKFFYNRRGEKIDCENRITEQEIYQWKNHVFEYFKIMKRKKGRFTPVEIWQYAVDNMKELQINDVTIDSWNYLRHDMEGYAREDKWLEDTLSHRNLLAEQSKLHFHTIIHPRGTGVLKDGKIRIPTEHDLKGGSEWFNNAKFLIIVHRENKEEKTTDIYIKKAKRGSNCYIGLTSLVFDVKIRRYFEYDGLGIPKYASKKQDDEEFNEPF